MTDDDDALFQFVVTEDGQEALPVQGVINLIQDLVDLIPTEKILVSAEPPEPLPGTGSDYRASRKLLIHPEEKPRVLKTSSGKWTVDFKIQEAKPELGAPPSYVNRDRHNRSFIVYDSWKRASTSQFAAAKGRR